MMTLTKLFSLLCCSLLALAKSSAAFSVQPDSHRVFVSTPSKSPEDLKLVSDCMTERQQIQCLHPSTTTDEAITVLLSMGISGAPVIDPDTGKLVGLVSSSDFMFKDFSGALLDIEGTPQDVESVVDVARKIVGTTVGEIMSLNIATINCNEPMAVAADMMARGPLHRLVVVSEENGDFVGILSRSDVMRDVLTTVRAALPERSTAGAMEEDVLSP